MKKKKEMSQEVRKDDKLELGLGKVWKKEKKKRLDTGECSS